MISLILLGLFFTLAFSQNGTPIGGQSVDMYYYKNSLYNHYPNGSNDANSSTNIGNWIARMAAGAPTPNEATLGSMFGFFTSWVTPSQANEFHSEITTTLIPRWTPSWTGAENIDLIGFVPDNFDGQSFDPAENTNMGQSYETKLLEMIDAWEANAPNPNRRYVIYAGWPALNNGYGGTPGDPSSISSSGYHEWRTYGLGEYQDWMELLVERLQNARPSLDIRLHNINKAVLMCHENTVVGSIDPNLLFEDRAPHGRSTWYFLAAVAEYIELFNEKPPVDFTFNPSWNVASEVTSNYQVIVDYIWTVLRGNVTSTDEIENKPILNVYPNPTTDKLHITSNEAEFRVEISNQLGQLVLCESNKLELDIHSLTAGTYYVRLIGKETSVQKIHVLN